MPRNGSGTYTRPQSDYIPGMTILATSVNSDLNDMAQALTASIARDGQTIPTANMPMGNYRHTGVADGTARTDYAALGQVQDGAFLWGGTAGGTANALTISLNPPLAAYAAGQEFRFISGAAANTGAVTLNINSLGAVAVNKGDGTVALSAGNLPASAIVTVTHDGTRFRLVDPVPIVNLSTAQATTSGTAIDFTGIPAGARRITLMFDDVSVSGLARVLVQLGSGSVQTTGYLGSSASVFGTNQCFPITSTAGFILERAGAGSFRMGAMTFVNISGNKWVQSHSVGDSAGTAMFGGGVVTLSGALDRLRVTTDGADTFDNGSVNIMWEF